MKQAVKKIFLFSCILTAFISCKKDENRITYLGGTPPVLTASSTTELVLTKPNAKQHALTFSWTNPEYQFTTGISSQDVSYFLQVDTSGSNFTTKPVSEIAILKDLTIDLNDSVLNAAINKISDTGLVVNVPHTIEFRIKSALTGGNSAVLYSNPITVVVTPYLDVLVPVPFTDNLYIIGSATGSGWNNPVDVPNQQFTKINAFTWEITANLIGGNEFLVIPDNGSWSNKYAADPTNLPVGNTGGVFGYNGGNSTYSANFPGPSASGSYKIVFNFKTGKYTITLQ